MAQLTLSSKEVLPLSGHDTNVPIEDGRQEISNVDDCPSETYIKSSNSKEHALKLGVGIRFRKSLNKFVVEYRPSQFKWKLWMGTYHSCRDAQRAFDVARFYAGGKDGEFYLKDTPALLHQMCPPIKDFKLVSKETRDKAFNQSLKKIAKEVIKKYSQDKSYGKCAAIDLLPPTTKPTCYSELEVVMESNLPDVDGENKDTFSLSTSTSEETLIQGGSQGDLSSLKMRSIQKEMILATCREQLETVKETLSVIKGPIIFYGNVSQFLQGDCKPKDDEIILLGRLQLEPNSLMEFIFANEANMASMVGVGIPNTIVTLKSGAMKVDVAKYVENVEHEELWDMDDHGFQVVTLHLPSIQNKYNYDIDELSAEEMAKEYGVGFNITPSGVPRSTVTRHGGEEFGYEYRLHELAKLWLWSNLQELVFKKEVFDVDNSIHKLMVSNPKITIWGLWEVFNHILSISYVQNDGSNASSGGGGDNGHENSKGEDGPGKDNHDGGNDMGGGGGGGGPTSDGALDWEEQLIVEVHPGYDCCKNSEYAKHIQSITIEPTLTFHFKKGIMGAHEIQTKLFVNYGMGNAGPNEFEDNHFAWYQNSLGISLQCMSQDAARIKHDSVNIMGVEDVKTNHSKTITTSMIPNSTTIGGGLTLKALSIAEGNIQISKTSSSMPTTSSQDVRIRELRGTQLSNGFIPIPTTDGGLQPHLSCKFRHLEIVPHEVLHSEECWRECASWSICGSLKGSIEGTWQGLNKEEACPYKFHAERSLKGLFWSDCGPAIKSKNYFKRKKVDEQKLEEKRLHQVYTVELYVNHAMTHIHRFRKFSRIEQGGTCHGVLSIEKINGVHIVPPGVHLN